MGTSGMTRKGRFRSGTISTTASRARIGPSIVTTPALSISSSRSGTSLSTPLSPLSSVPSDDESGSEREEFYDALEHPLLAPPIDIMVGGNDNASVQSEDEIKEEVDEAQEENEEVSEMKMVLDKVNARRVIHAEHGGLNGLESETIAGFVVRLVRGDLGLSRAAPQEPDDPMQV